MARDRRHAVGGRFVGMEGKKEEGCFKQTFEREP
jgi:hypothetical protein